MKSDSPLKGRKNGNCNRTACQKPGAIHKHLTMCIQDVYYCTDCAVLINRECKRFNDPLCFDEEEIKKAVDNYYDDVVPMWAGLYNVRVEPDCIISEEIDHD